MTTVVLPAPLRPYAKGQKEVEITGRDVAEGLTDLVGQYPGLRDHLFNERGDLRPYVHLFLNGEEVALDHGRAPSLPEGARLMLLPSIAGGNSAEEARSV